MKRLPATCVFPGREGSHGYGARLTWSAVSLVLAGVAIAGCTSAGVSTTTSTVGVGSEPTTGAPTSRPSSDTATAKGSTSGASERVKGESSSTPDRSHLRNGPSSRVAGPTPTSITSSSSSEPVPSPVDSRRRAARQPSGSALDAYRTWVDQASTGDFGSMWNSLAPTQRSGVARNRFSLCQNEFTQEGGLTAITYKRTVSQKPRTITIAGTSERVRAIAINAVLGLESHDPQTLSVTLAWYADGTQWRWMLTATQLAAYHRNTCPAF